MSAHLPPLGDDVVRKLDVAGPRYTSYPTVPEWGPMTGGDAAAALAVAGAAPDPLSVYVHIPFCREMCTYCGCHVIVAKDPRKADSYLELVRREVRLVRAALGGRHPISRIHLGGGTPTFLDERQLAELHAMLAEDFEILPDAELALEVDPVVTRPTQLELLARLGFRRLSMGVQDLDPDVQRAVARIQTEEETRAVIERARALGFRSVNVDLIYGLPRQTPETWKRTIERVVAMGPDRVSLFSFAYVPTVKPHQRRLQMADLPSPNTKIELFRIGHDTMVDAGYRAIGMDHFARPGDELAVAQEQGTLWRDFQGYSAGRGGAGTVALGVSSISDVGGTYYQNVKTLPKYAAALERGELPVERGHRLSDDDRRRRQIIGEVMCRLQVALTDEEASAFAGPLHELEGEGLCTLDGASLRLTPLGRVFVRNVAMVFDAYLERERAGARRPAFSRTV
jgi:oxygen-independent coproporphyrinogen-3 oxidase